MKLTFNGDELRKTLCKKIKVTGGLSGVELTQEVTEVLMSMTMQDIIPGGWEGSIRLEHPDRIRGQTRVDTNLEKLPEIQAVIESQCWICGQIEKNTMSPYFSCTNCGNQWTVELTLTIQIKGQTKESIADLQDSEKYPLTAKDLEPTRAVAEAWWTQMQLLYLLLPDATLQELDGLREESASGGLVPWAASLRKDLLTDERFLRCLKKNARTMLTNSHSGYATGTLPLLINLPAYFQWAKRAQELVNEYKRGRVIGEALQETKFIFNQLVEEGLSEDLHGPLQELLGAIEPSLRMEELCRKDAR